MARLSMDIKELRKMDYYDLARVANKRLYDLRKQGLTDTAAYEEAMASFKALGREGKLTFPEGKLTDAIKKDAKNFVVKFLAKKSSRAGIVKKARKKSKETLGQYLDDKQIKTYFEFWKNADIRAYLERFGSETDTQEINRWEIIDKASELGLNVDEMKELLDKANRMSDNDKQFKEFTMKLLELRELQDFNKALEEIELDAMY